MVSRSLGGSWGFIIALVLCSANACGGAEDSSLANPPADTSSGSTSPVPEAGGGNHLDAMALEAGPGDDMIDATMLGSDDASDDASGGSGGDDSGSSACKSQCLFGEQCCSKVGNLLYGRCYSPLACAPFCC